MQVRPYKASDLEALRRIHAAQGFGYAFPDLDEPLFLTKLVLTDEEPPAERPGADGASSTDDAPAAGNCSVARTGKGIAGAALLRLTAEAYLLLDPAMGSPRERWNWLLALHEATARDAAARGLEDVHAWLPPEIAAKFGRRLLKLGWVRDDRWTPYCKRLS
jgi:hypothetical protein